MEACIIFLAVILALLILGAVDASNAPPGIRLH